MGVVAACQVGLVGHLPDPPLPMVDSDAVDASGEVCQFLRTPDATLGLVSYALTLVLAGMGGADRSRRRPWIPLALLAKGGGALLLTAEQASRHRRFCAWCLAAAAMSVAMVPQALPEARAAVDSPLVEPKASDPNMTTEGGP